jgi:hypothetical protein
LPPLRGNEKEKIGDLTTGQDTWGIRTDEHPNKFNKSPNFPYGPVSIRNSYLSSIKKICVWKVDGGHGKLDVASSQMRLLLGYTHPGNGVALIMGSL